MLSILQVRNRISCMDRGIAYINDNVKTHSKFDFNQVYVTRIYTVHMAMGVSCAFGQGVMGIIEGSIIRCTQKVTNNNVWTVLCMFFYN